MREIVMILYYINGSMALYYINGSMVNIPYSIEYN